MNHVVDDGLTPNPSRAATPLQLPVIATSGGSNFRLHKSAESWKAPDRRELSSALHYRGICSKSGLHKIVHRSKIRVGRS